MTLAEERTEELAGILGRARVVPILRVSAAPEALDAFKRAAGAGLSVIELTTTTRDWADVLSEVHWLHPLVTTGVGTVVTEEDAHLAIAQGAEFLVSPYPVVQVRRLAAERGVPFLEGGFTPAEVASAASRGVAKLFPAHVGGTSYLRSLLSTMPGARVVPTGGIAPGDVSAWLRAGALAVGLGRALFEGDIGEQLRTAFADAPS